MLLLLMLDYLGTFAFAVSGALKAARTHMDIFGLTVLALVTAIGGGTVRDVMLQERPFWLNDPNYVFLALLGSVSVLLMYRLLTRFEMGLLWWDAIGLGAFTVIGSQRAMDHGVGIIGTVVLACLTAVGGGMLRDVLSADVPVVLRKEVYASVAILGSLLYYYLNLWQVPHAVSMPVTMITVTTIRLVCLHAGFGLPALRVAEEISEAQK